MIKSAQDRILYQTQARELYHRSNALLEGMAKASDEYGRHIQFDIVQGLALLTQAVVMLAEVTMYSE